MAEWSLDRLTGYEWSEPGDGAWHGHYGANTMVLWGHCPGVGSPLALVHKPKSLSAEDWAKVKVALRESIKGLLIA